MRVRIVMAAVALLLPSVATAQRRAPGLDGRGPERRLPTGRQPEVVARAQQIVRSRYSVEAYPLLNRVEATGLGAGSPPAKWTSIGSGTRLDWRQTDYLSWTIDVTASYLGGPAITETAEVGTRIGSQRWNDRLRPFADLRVGFEHISQSLSNQDLSFTPVFSQSSAMRYGRGFGAAAGAGVEYFLTNALALTTAASVMRTSMTGYDFTGMSVPTGETGFRMTTYRLAVGLKYNRVRYIGTAKNTIPVP